MTLPNCGFGGVVVLVFRRRVLSFIKIDHRPLKRDGIRFIPEFIIYTHLLPSTPHKGRNPRTHIFPSFRKDTSDSVKF